MMSSILRRTIYGTWRSNINQSVFFLSTQKHSTSKTTSIQFSPSSLTAVRHQSSNNNSSTDDDKPISKKGVIVDKKPVKIRCEEGKMYSWCSCGLSQKQPFCDGSHKKSSSGMKPVRFTAPQTKEYFLCNCKQTNKQPYCDGTHKKL